MDDKVSIVEVTDFIIDIFDRLDVQTPGIIDKIIDYVHEELINLPHPENWNEQDVNTAFVMWLDAKCNVKS